MAEQRVYAPDSDNPAVRSGRRSVRNFLLGFPEDVQDTIMELHVKQFSEVGLWSRPLTFSEIQTEFLLNPGEVMRVYKRYMTR